LDLRGRAAAFVFGVAEVAAGAGVHRRDEHEAAGERFRILTVTNHQPKGPIKMKAYSYLRVSSAQQAKETRDGINRQMQMAEDFCKREGITLSTETFRDLGVSAFKGHNKDPRSALSAFIQGVDLGKIETPSYLLIERLDRLSREDVISAMNLLRDICERGVTVVSIADGHKYTSESIRKDISQIMMMVLSFALANEESAKKQDRLKKAWESARRKAQTGIKIKTSYPSWLKLKGEEFTVIEDKADQIRLMFKLFLEDGYGYKSISNYLNKKGEKTVNGLAWYPQIVKNLLKNPAVIGELHTAKREDGKRVKTGDVVQGYYPSIVSETDFYTVQSRLSVHPKRVGKPNIRTGSNLWDGLFKCGYCGGTMGLFHSHSLICWNAFNNQGCIRHGWSKFDYERPLLSELKDVIIERKSELNIPIKKEIESLQAKVEDITNRIEKLNVLVETLLDPSDTIKRINVLTVERSKIRDTIKSKKSLLDELTDSATVGVDITGILNDWNESERLQIQRLMQKHLEQIVVFPAGDSAVNEEFRRLRDKMVEEGRGIHSVNKELVQTLGIKERRYMEVHTRNPVKRGNKTVTCFRVDLKRPAMTVEEMKRL